jgi:HrpA-like RNA helicase
VEAALQGLLEVGAITLLPPAPAAALDVGSGTQSTAAAAAASETLTPLGRLLALLPLEPRLGKLLVTGATLGCLSPALVRIGGGGGGAAAAAAALVDCACPAHTWTHTHT